ncbi:MAG: formate dehydrogenase subunit alpha [Actinobacteria bacterium]|nr:formate dehydrogenase subunit alpha [Actinomycetota bacterium]
MAGLAKAFGSGAMTNTIEDLAEADVILAIGTNTTEAHPIIGYQMKKAVRERGAKIIVADPRRIPLVDFAEIWLAQRPGTDVALLNGLMNVILSEGLADRDFIAERTEGFAELEVVLPKYTPDVVGKITGVAAEDIRQAARLYANAGRAAICYTMGITQHTSGTDNVLAIANLAMITGNLGKRGAGVNPLRGQNNVQGACDMGGLPNVLTAYQPVADEAVREKFEKAWGVELSPNPGLTLSEVTKKAGEGEIKALYIMGENPALSDPDSTHVKEALEKLDFLVVQDIFLTETAELADVVLPSACFAEKDGTFTNSERRVQRVRKATEPPGEAKPDWRIIAEIGLALRYPMHYESAEEIYEEMRKLTPSYAGISYERLEKGGLHWPCPTEEHPGTPILHTQGFTRGKGLFHAVDHRAPAEEADEEYPMILTTGRSLWQYHTGTMTRRSEALNSLAPRSWVEMHPADAAKHGIADGEDVVLTSRRGCLTSTAMVTEGIREGVIFMPFHYAESAANVLTNTAIDPVAKIPELKVCAVKMAKA